MKLKLQFNTFLFFLLLPGSTIASGNNPSFDLRYIASEDGLPQPYVYNMIQDSDGYLWLGTGNGLARFDGYELSNFTIDDSLAGNFITVAFPYNGTLFFGHMNGSLSCFNGTEFQKIQSLAENQSSITAIGTDLSGNLWASTNASGLLLINDQQKAIPSNTFGENLIVYDFEFISDHELMIGSIDGLYHYKLNQNKNLVLKNKILEIPEVKIQQIEKSKLGEGYFIATENEGVFHLSFYDSKVNCYSLTNMLIPELEFVQHILEDRTGAIWISTFGKGLYKLASKTNGRFSSVSQVGLQEYRITDVKFTFEDREGNIWLSEFGKGAGMIAPKEFHYQPSESFSPGKSITAITADQKSLWMGTDHGIIRRNKQDPEEQSIYYLDPDQKSIEVSALLSHDHTLWIGTEAKGIYFMNMETESIEKFPLHDGALENSINTLAGNDSALWIGTRKGLCRLNLRTNEIIWYTIQAGGLPHNYINHLFFDEKGILWIATLSNILCYFDQESIIRLPAFNVAGIKSIQSIGVDTENNIWFATKGSGVFRIKNDSAINLSMTQGLLSDFCYTIFGDKEGSVWVGHRKGLSKIREGNLFIRQIVNDFDIYTELNFQSHSFFKASNKLLIGSDNGLVSYNYPNPQQYETGPMLSIRSVLVNNNPINYNESINLSPGKYKLEIQYIGIHFGNPEGVKYQYILEGYDNSYVAPTDEKSAIYQALTEGKYVFKIEAASSNGIVTKEAVTLKITVRKPIWKFAWFYILIFILLTGFVIGYVKRREYYLIQDKKKLEEKVIERTAEVLKQKEEIEKQKNLIDAKNKDITDSINYARQIQSAVLPPESMLTKWFQDSFLSILPLHIISGDFYWFKKLREYTVVALADCTGHGVPGSFMSMLGISLLNEITNQVEKPTSDGILNKLRLGVISALHQDTNERIASDGLDISLCVINQKTHVLQFSGAFNPLVLVQNGKLEWIKGDKMSVNHSHLNKVPFSSREFKIKEGDIFYMFTDGYQDQFGGPRKKKFTRKRLDELLQSIHQLPMPEQAGILKETIQAWKKETIQIDDISFLGIKY